MTKEELIELKGRISKLNDSEKKRILNELNNGKEYDFNSGYATIDRPWQRNFNMDEFYKIKNDKNVCQDIIDENIGYDTGIAIEYFLKKFHIKNYLQILIKQLNLLRNMELKMEIL